MAKRKGQPIGGQFVPLLHQVLDCEAWRCLSPVARLVHISLRRLVRPETNGKVYLSVRDASEAIGVHRNTVQRAYLDLQAAGFIVATELAHLGVEGKGRATTWRLTELGHFGARPTKDFLNWSAGNDFTVLRAPRPTPKKQKPVTNKVQPCHRNGAVLADFGSGPVTRIVTQSRVCQEGAASGAPATFAVLRHGEPIRWGVRTVRGAVA